MGPKLRQKWASVVETSTQEVDRTNATIIGGVVGLVLCALQAAAFTMAYPTALVGPFGWVLAGVVLTAAAIGSWSLVDREEALTSRQLWIMCLVGMADVAIIAALSGSQSERDLMVLPIVFAATIQPPRRALGAMVLADLLTLVLVVGASFDGQARQHLLFDVLLWAALGVLGFVLFSRLRGQRSEQRSERTALVDLARLDPLTELGNRRALKAALEREEARVARAGGTCAVAFFDLEAFKQINDRHGHRTGDRCLEKVAAVLRTSLRRPDEAFRWGGDEFVVLLPGASSSTAQVAVERLREAIAEADATAVGPLRTRWGVAEFGAGTSAQDAVAAADLELLERKGARLDRSLIDQALDSIS